MGNDCIVVRWRLLPAGDSTCDFGLRRGVSESRIRTRSDSRRRKFSQKEHPSDRRAVSEHRRRSQERRRLEVREKSRDRCPSPQAIDWIGGLHCANSTLPESSVLRDETRNLASIGSRSAAPMPSTGSSETSHQQEALDMLVPRQTSFTTESFVAGQFLDGQVMQLVLDGRDIIWQVTGRSPKSFMTFLVGLLRRIEPEKAQHQALIVAASRSSAQLTQGILDEIAGCIGARCQASIGGTSVRHEIDALRGGPHVIIGTPGRVVDMIKKRIIVSSDLKTILLQDGEVLSSKIFKTQMDDIMKDSAKDVQVLLFCKDPSSEQLAGMSGFVKNHAHISQSSSQMVRTDAHVEQKSVDGLQFDYKTKLLASKAMRMFENTGTDDQTAMPFLERVREVRRFMMRQSEPIPKKNEADATPAKRVFKLLKGKFKLDDSELERTVVALGLRRHGDYFQCSSLYGNGRLSFVRLKETAVKANPDGSILAEDHTKRLVTHGRRPRFDSIAQSD